MPRIQAKAKRPATCRNTHTQIVVLFAILALSVLPVFAQEAPAESPARPTAELIRRIVISIQERKLAVIENGHVVKVYPVAVGAPGTPSPTGEFRVINRITDPTYYVPSQVVAPGPENPLGTRWMGLSLKGYGIHGTNAPSSIGQRASHGCIRMRSEDVEELFELVRIGDVVELHAQQTPQLVAIFSAPLAARPAGGPTEQPATAVVASAVLP